MAESKTARASRITIGEVKKDPFDTPEKKIAELRKQRDAKLAVVRYDFIDALLVEYDKERKAVLHLGASTASLLKRAEEAEAQNKADLYVMKEISAARDEIVKERDSLREAIVALNDTVQILTAENSQLVEQRDALALGGGQ